MPSTPDVPRAPGAAPPPPTPSEGERDLVKTTWDRYTGGRVAQPIGDDDRLFGAAPVGGVDGG